MPSRHRSRQRALQVLFQVDVNSQDPFDAIDDFYETLHTSEDDTQDLPENPQRPPRDGFMEQLVRGTASQLEAIDLKITAHSQHWRLERMATVDRNILRVAVYEMCYLDTPAPVVIDQALELARRFSSDEAVAFINGVLDAVRREMEPEPPPDAGAAGQVE
ncbi:MAG: transcription antitermination factor NusB [Bryobacterales bacterium]|nr:transcription antitermination factor NusB [Bryobacterales bacterium]